MDYDAMRLFILVWGAAFIAKLAGRKERGTLGGNGDER